MESHHNSTTIDYRNGRYQGQVDQKACRSRIGLLIDDDLSFYSSEWSNNMLNGQTLVYISHGKYIYGSWKANEPNGLNVFRTGDTVLVGQFSQGNLIGRILVIFQRFNIIAVLQTSQFNEKLEVVSSGKLHTHDDLLKYVHLLDVQMPQHYFSLIKFVTNFAGLSDQSLISTPCVNSNCYFGFKNGLAIVFNSNNGVVSVGHHQNKQLTGYGGFFDGKFIQEGNFDLKQTITYSKKRPNLDIYAIFQKIHKRSLNFKNQYFDSKVKTLGNLQQILKGNIQKIVNYNMKNKIHSVTQQDLNDSLDYQNLDQFEQASQRKSHIKEKSTQFIKPSEYKKPSECIKQTKHKQKKQEGLIKRSASFVKNNSSHIQSVNIEQKQTYRKSQTKPDSSVYYAKKSPIRYKQQNQKAYLKKSKNQLIAQYKIKDQCKRGRSPIEVSKAQQKRQIAKEKNKTFTNVPKFGGLEIQEPQHQAQHNNIQKQIQDYKIQLQKSRSKQKVQGTSISKVLKRPSYQDIQQRRKRILSQFKEIGSNSKISVEVSNSKNQNKSQVQKSHIRSQQIEIQIPDDQYEKRSLKHSSPCMKQSIGSFTQSHENSQDGFMPLSLVNQNVKSNKRNLQSQNKQKQNDTNYTPSSFLRNRLQTDENTQPKPVNKFCVNQKSNNRSDMSRLRNRAILQSKSMQNQQNIQQNKFQFINIKDRFSHRQYAQNQIGLNQNQRGRTQNQRKGVQNQKIAQYQRENKQEAYNQMQYTYNNRQGIQNRKQQNLKTNGYGQYEKSHKDLHKQQVAHKEQITHKQSITSSTISRRQKAYQYYFQQ